MERTINYKDVTLRCEFEIEPIFEQSYYEPESGGNMYDLLIYVQETEVSDLFTKDQITDIEQLIYEEL